MTCVRPTVFRLLAVAAALAAPLAEAAADPRVSDLRAIALHDGVNPVPNLTPDGRAGVIVRAQHDGSPIADGRSVDYLVLAPRPDDPGQWTAVDAQTTPSLISDVPFGGVLLTAAPHTGEDWKRSLAFARGEVDGAPALLLILAERDMRQAPDAYAAVPAEITLFRLRRDPDLGDLRFVPIARQRTTRCYGDVQLALSEVEGLPLPKDYAGPKAAEACRGAGR